MNRAAGEILKTTDEICAVLRISRQTLWRLTKENPALPGRYVVGRTTRWSESQLLAWLGEQETRH
ncbi:helix-turn-helix domain-containing protein [Halopseudomonas nanhaiensis]|uniref:helix-turn-helix transcriptional regulator n=1 Tax=Halopseudomonas nanhaiensis TaxID=2830842 RepID=UPI001CC04A2B|nr:helix-turn-helix domain-containing protein [Halopseudomonas nanhaiensis]